MSKNDELKRLQTMVAGALVDKATIVGLLIKEFKEQYGDEALIIAGRAAYKRGEALGKRIRKYMQENGRDVEDLREIRKAFAEMSGSTAKRKDYALDKHKMEYDLTYCPWVDGWHKAGFSDEEVEMFCDVLAESDKAMPKAINPKIELSNDQGLTKGKNGCRLLWEIT